MSIVMESTTSRVWYFAYGSNMDPSILTGRRKIHPRGALVVQCPGYKIAFNVPGIPFLEPALAGLSKVGTLPKPININKKARNNEKVTETLPVHGIAYDISLADLYRVFATEGGGVAYEFESAQAKVLIPVGDLRVEQGQTSLEVITLIARKPASGRRPSQRYMVRLLFVHLG
jgi:hypothetical protein